MTIAITEISVATTKAPRARNILGPPDLEDFKRSSDNISAREPVMVRRSFKARWFVWRSALPISMISGLTCEEILSGRSKTLRQRDGRSKPDGSKYRKEYGYGSRYFYLERSMAIWICRTIGDISFSQIGAVIDRKNVTVMRAFNRADDAITARVPKYFDLLTDVLYLENNELGSQKGHFIRSNRS